MLFAPTDINKYAASIYTANKEKGFWIGEKNYIEKLVLIHSEMYEALEADRKARSAANVEKCLDLLDKDGFAEAFVEHVKDSIEDELADVVIRVLDMAGGFELFLKNNYTAPSLHFWDEQHDSLNLLQREFMSFQACVLEFGNIVNRIVRAEVQTRAIDKILERGLNELLEFVLAMSNHFRIDLWMHVKLKLAYNTTRAHKHGKRY